MKNREIGNLGEKIAAKFLFDKGWVYLKRNYYEKNFGEIDLIFEDTDNDNQIVFIEVKTRSSEKYGEGFEAVEEKKLRKMAKTGELFCLKNGINFEDTRFDIISIFLNKNLEEIGKNCKIKHLKKVL